MRRRPGPFDRMKTLDRINARKRKEVFHNTETVREETLSEDAIKVLRFLTETMQAHERKLAEQDLKVQIAVEIMDLAHDANPTVEQYPLFARAYDLTSSSSPKDWQRALARFKQERAA